MTVSGELHSISEAIGELRAEARSAREARKIVYEKLEELSALAHEIKALRVEVADLKPHVDDWRKTRNRAVGALLGVTMLGVGSGAAASPLLVKLANLFRGN